MSFTGRVRSALGFSITWGSVKHAHVVVTEGRNTEGKKRKVESKCFSVHQYQKKTISDELEVTNWYQINSNCRSIPENTQPSALLCPEQGLRSESCNCPSTCRTSYTGNRRDTNAHCSASQLLGVHLPVPRSTQHATATNQPSCWYGLYDLCIPELNLGIAADIILNCYFLPSLPPMAQAIHRPYSLTELWGPSSPAHCLPASSWLPTHHWVPHQCCEHNSVLHLSRNTTGNA